MTSVLPPLPARLPLGWRPRSFAPITRRPADEDDPWDDPDWEEWEQADTEPEDLDQWDEPLPDDDDPPGLHDDEAWDDDEDLD